MNSAESIVERGSLDQSFDDTITLDEEQRHRRRMAMVSDGGIAFLLNLPEARLLREGDGIQLDDGRLIEVRAKPEPLYEVTGHGAVHLLQLAWHLGNRHLAAAIDESRILIRRDRVIKDMVEGLGGHVREVEAAFDPTGGAYSHGAPHHDH